MSGSDFNLIAQKLQRQQQIMERLQAENRSLRQELVELREGRGIFIDIGGKRFALNSSTVSPTTSSVPVKEVAPASPETRPAHTATKSPDLPTPETAQELVAEAPTQESIPAPQDKPSEEQTAKSTFLEEMMISEFETALTSPLAVWTGPVKKVEPETSAEDQKAALRRELMGSYLLE